MVNRCFLSPLEKEVFRAERGQFCMDIGENENTPVTGIQDKLIHYWKEYPEMLRKCFRELFWTEAFCWSFVPRRWTGNRCWCGF